MKYPYKYIRALKESSWSKKVKVGDIFYIEKDEGLNCGSINGSCIDYTRIDRGEFEVLPDPQFKPGDEIGFSGRAGFVRALCQYMDRIMYLVEHPDGWQGSICNDKILNGKIDPSKNYFYVSLNEVKPMSTSSSPMPPTSTYIPSFKFNVGDIVNCKPGGYYFIDINTSINTVIQHRTDGLYTQKDRKIIDRKYSAVNGLNWYRWDPQQNWISEDGLEKVCSGTDKIPIDNSFKFEIGEKVRISNNLYRADSENKTDAVRSSATPGETVTIGKRVYENNCNWYWFKWYEYWYLEDGIEKIKVDSYQTATEISIPTIETVADLLPFKFNIGDIVDANGKGGYVGNYEGAIPGYDPGHLYSKFKSYKIIDKKQISGINTYRFYEFGNLIPEDSIQLSNPCKLAPIPGYSTGIVDPGHTHNLDTIDISNTKIWVDIPNIKPSTDGVKLQEPMILKTEEKQFQLQ